MSGGMKHHVQAMILHARHISLWLLIRVVWVKLFWNFRELGGVPQLLDAEDIILMGKKPDYKVMFTYMTEMYRNLKKREAIPE